MIKEVVEEFAPRFIPGSRLIYVGDAGEKWGYFELFSTTSAGLIYVTAFPTRRMMTRYLSAIAWETEVWIAEIPSHLIHFDGERFLGPYAR